MRELTFTLEGDSWRDGFNDITFRITEQDDGTLLFEISGDRHYTDLNAIYFDVADESLLDGLSIRGEDVGRTDFDADDVSRVGGGTYAGRKIIRNYGEFDVGAQIGSLKWWGDDKIQSTPFVLDHAIPRI